ncbi:hypothetical protein AACH10_17995 [Ideonella sp. DXS22W]|uniref:Uncharacterized protein n=1 Tax=Pseudaquabacterium inlustre TaxID=2984192 RepID=A0ABU9CJX0_9BURK
MCQQADDLIRIHGRTYSVIGRPLDGADSPTIKHRLGELRSYRSSLYRGYRCTWEIRAGRLWLADWYGMTADGDVGLGWLFPGAPGPVHATWFTGELVTGRGKADQVGMYLRGWPYYRTYDVQAGEVLGSTLKDDRAAFRAGAARHRRMWETLDALDAAEKKLRT